MIKKVICDGDCVGCVHWSGMNHKCKMKMNDYEVVVESNKVFRSKTETTKRMRRVWNQGPNREWAVRNMFHRPIYIRINIHGKPVIGSKETGYVIGPGELLTGWVRPQ